jgi:phosphoribosyl 1,2-cyclic phosphodiesterase
VVLDDPGHRPIILDLGTGLRFYGLTQPKDGTFSAVALVSHLHWDHIQGLPFFPPVLAPGARMDVYGPAQPEGLTQAFRTFLSPPYFPISVDDLPGTIKFNDVKPGSFTTDGAEIVVADVPHVGPTLGFRVTRGGVSVAYVSDHQQPGCMQMEVSDEVLALCDGVDLLIHDAQYTDDEFVTRDNWGHCTVDYAVNVAAQCGAKRLALFHHDPLHDDATLDALWKSASRAGAAAGVAEVFAASEGMTLSLAPTGAR